MEHLLAAYYRRAGLSAQAREECRDDWPLRLRYRSEVVARPLYRSMPDIRAAISTALIALSANSFKDLASLLFSVIWQEIILFSRANGIASDIFLIAKVFDIAAIGSLLSGIGTLVLAYIAYKGLSAWRSQFRGQSEIQISQDILSSVHEAAEIIDYMLKDDVMQVELDETERYDEEEVWAWEIRAAANVPIVRYEKFQDRFDRLRSLYFRARALLPVEAVNAVRTVLEVPHRISSATKKMVRIKIRLSEIKKEGMDANNLEVQGLQEEIELLGRLFMYSEVGGVKREPSLLADARAAESACSSLLLPILKDR